MWHSKLWISVKLFSRFCRKDLEKIKLAKEEEIERQEIEKELVGTALNSSRHFSVHSINLSLSNVFFCWWNSMRRHWKPFQEFNFCVLYFYIFHQEKSLKKIMKNAFYKLLKRPFHFQDIQIFVLSCSPLFSLVGHCWIFRRSWLKMIPNVYDVIIRLIRNLKNGNCVISWGLKKIWYWSLLSW